MHRDLKPENILIDVSDHSKPKVKITDFGFATKIEKNINLCCGSPIYMAPEIFEGKEYNEKVDIWALGVITYILLSGKAPYQGQGKEVG